MRSEILFAIRSTLEGDTALLTALGATGTARIIYGWPSGEEEHTAADPVLLAFGPDISGGPKLESGNAAGQRVPDFELPLHLFGVDPDKIAVAADALYTLLDDATTGVALDTTNYRVLRIKVSGDIGPFEEDRDWYHRIITFTYMEIWAK